MQIKIFCFNPFQENTFIVTDENNDAIIIDPGMYHENEFIEFENYITENNIHPKLILNTHAHLDHVFGLTKFMEKYKIPFALHNDDLALLDAAPRIAESYGVFCAPCPLPTQIVKEGDTLNVGNLTMDIIHIPGHSPGSIGIYFKKENKIIVGDVLFKESVGRTDFEGGSAKALYHSITQKLFTLNDDLEVFPGHGPSTTIGHEKIHNQVVAYLNQ